jgi:hypothetical protein
MVFFLASCTAYRDVSRGRIEEAPLWSMVYGGGSNFTRVGSALQTDSRRIIFVPCNYGEKDVYMILPVPMPLGSLPGVKQENGFVIGVIIIAKNESILLDPKTIQLNLSDGREFTPEKIKNTFFSCEDSPNNIETGSWGSIKKQRADSGHQLQLSLFFPTAFPSVEEQFSISLGSLVFGGKEVPIPEVFFHKGAAWGGW